MTRGRAAIAAVAALALAGTGCADDRGGPGPEILRVYVSAPLQGPRAAEGQAIFDGARLALSGAGGRVGKVRVRGVYLDDSGASGWSLARTAANARRASEDATSIGYVGDLDSGATRASLPITNQAEIPQVSPGSTAVDLTRIPRFGGAEPDDYRPSGRQTFVRVVPDDEVPARAAALWAKKLGARTFAAGGQGAYGRISADAFASAARSLGLRAFSPADVQRPGGILRPHSPGADAAYYGLTSIPRAKPSAGSLTATSSTVFGPPVFVDRALLRAAPGLQDRLRIVSPFLDPALLPAAGRGFVRAYRRRFGHEPDPVAAYGYESMALLLDAIRRGGGADADRGSVTDSLLATTTRHSILGTYSIDGNGDTTLDTVSGYRVSDGLPVFPVRLTAPR